MRCVTVESPFSGNVEQNIDYARRCMLDCIKRGEAPFASHLLYTQDGILRDTDARERFRGIEVGLEIARRMDVTVVYIDLGISEGMLYGIGNAIKHERPVEYRRLGEITKQTEQCALEELDLWMADWGVDTTERGWLLRWAARRARNVFGFLADAMIQIAALSPDNGDTLSTARFLATQALKTGAIEGDKDADH